MLFMMVHVHGSPSKELRYEEVKLVERPLASSGEIKPSRTNEHLHFQALKSSNSFRL